MKNNTPDLPGMKLAASIITWLLLMGILMIVVNIRTCSSETDLDRTLRLVREQAEVYGWEDEAHE